MHINTSSYRIQRTPDDGSLPVAGKSLKAQVSGLGHATRNASDGISVSQTAEGAHSAVQAMLQSAIANLQVSNQNLTASESQIADTGMSLEMAAFTKNQILLQAGTATLAEASADRQAILDLLQ
jgi:flagellin